MHLNAVLQIRLWLILLDAIHGHLPQHRFARDVSIQFIEIEYVRIAARTHAVLYALVAVTSHTKGHYASFA
jgi:hypothetical protein